MAFDLGDTVALSVLVRDSDGDLADAGAITLTITQPDGTVGPGVTVTNPPAVTGTYVYEFTPTQAGHHKVHWVATGANSCSYSDSFDVREANPPYIVSLADAKRGMNWTTADDARDEEFRRYVEGATTIIEQEVGPVVVREFTERHPSGYCLVLKHKNALEVVSVDGWYTTGSSHDAADVVLDEDTGIAERADGGYFSGGPFRVVVKAGMGIVPANVSIAARDLIRINFRAQQGGDSSRYDEPGEFRPDLGMFVPNTVLSNLRPQADVAGFA